MSNKYETFDDERIEYSYPIDWIKRNKKYLQKVEDRKNHHNNNDEYEVEMAPPQKSESFPHVYHDDVERTRKNFLIINCGDSTDNSA